MTGSRSIVEIANELFEYSNMFVEIRCDRAMPIPGFSLIEEDIHGLLKPVTVLNPELLREDPSVIAHVMAHEWGHHVMGHIDIFSPVPTLIIGSFELKIFFTLLFDNLRHVNMASDKS